MVHWTLNKKFKFKFVVQSFDGSQSIVESIPGDVPAVQGDAGSDSESEDEYGYTKSEHLYPCISGRY
jgi:hypothetical protein